MQKQESKHSWKKSLASISLFLTFLQTQQQTSSDFFYCLLRYMFACRIVCFCCSLFLLVGLFVSLCDFPVIIASVSSIFVSMYLYLFMFVWVGIFYYNFTIIYFFSRNWHLCIWLVLFIHFVLFFIHLLVHACIIMYIFLHFFILIIYSTYLLFARMFLCLHVDNDVTNSSLYLCLFIYIYAPVCVLKCWYFGYMFLLYFHFNISFHFCKYNVLSSLSSLHCY